MDNRQEERSIETATYDNADGGGGERIAGVPRVGSLYDSPRHTGRKWNHPGELWEGAGLDMYGLYTLLYGEYWDLPVYMRPINGGWC